MPSIPPREMWMGCCHIRIVKTPRHGPPEERLRAAWIGTEHFNVERVEIDPSYYGDKEEDVPKFGYQIPVRGALMRLVRNSRPAFCWYQFIVQQHPHRRLVIVFYEDEAEIINSGDF